MDRIEPVSSREAADNPGSSQARRSLAELVALASLCEDEASPWRDRLRNLMDSPLGLPRPMGCSPRTRESGQDRRGVPRVPGPICGVALSAPAHALTHVPGVVGDEAETNAVTCLDVSGPAVGARESPCGLYGPLRRCRPGTGGLEPDALSVRCAQPGLARWLKAQLSGRGPGPMLFVRLSDGFMAEAPCRDAPRGRRLVRRGRTRHLWWLLMHQVKTSRRLGLVFDAGIRPASRFGLEVPATSVDPLFWQAAAAPSACLGFELYLPGFVRARSGLDDPFLEETVRCAIRLADNLIDAVRWSTPSLARDAAQARRLSLHLTGVDAAILKLGLDPRSFRALARGKELARRAYGLAYEASLAVARERGSYPAFPATGLLRGIRQPEFRRRLQKELDAHALRHSQLVTLSPRSILSTAVDRGDIEALSNLLPVLSVADNISCQLPAVVRGMAPQRLARFLRGVWACVRSSHRPACR